jgi:hypothetical protein
MSIDRENAMTLGLSDIEEALLTESGPLFLVANEDSELDESTPKGSLCCCSIELDRDLRKVHVYLQKIVGPDLGLATDGFKSWDALFQTQIVQLLDVDLPDVTDKHIDSHGFDSEFMLLLFAYSETLIAWHMGVCNKDDFCLSVESEDLLAVEKLIEKYLRPLASENCGCGERARKLVGDLSDVGY